MRKVFRWAGIGLAAIVGLLLLAVLTVFGLSELSLGKEHRASAERLAAPTPAQLADAGRQGRILGCVSCHGEGLKGKVMFDEPGFARMVAPNLTRIAAKSSDQQLAAAIRQGVGHEGRALFVMPSPQYSHLTDQEVTAIIRWIRSLPPAPDRDEGRRLGPFARLALVTGGFRSARELVAEYRKTVPIDLGPDHAAGRRIVMTNCTECHGPALYGQKMGSGDLPPNLDVAAGYDLEQFKTLLHRGVTPSGKPLGLMKEVAVNDFAHLTDQEIAAVHAYLAARAKKLGG